MAFSVDEELFGGVGVVCVVIAPDKELVVVVLLVLFARG